ncbi:MAG: sulfatase [Planctomycetes bacterium]|nr:sulfatase [Planctomycetota bacterium]
MGTHARACLLILALWGTGPPPGEAGEPAPDRSAGDYLCRDSNVVFFTLTNLRADHLGAYGYSRSTSPNLDQLAARSLVFENAYSHASWTLPVAVSLFTSQYPFTHGLMNRENFEKLDAGAVTIIDLLKKNGYLTAAFVGDRDYGAAFGLTSRFDAVFDTLTDQDPKDWKKYGVLKETVPRAIAWLRDHYQRKFFLFIQGYDVHCPFAVPEENRMFDPDYQGSIDFTRCYWTFKRTRPIKVRRGSEEREVYLLKTKSAEEDEFEARFYPEDVKHMVALYDGEIYNSDKWVKNVLDELKRLGLEKKTIIVFFSEHGDMFGKHGRFMRGGPLRGTFYDDVLRIPLIIHHPGLKPRRIDGLVQGVDLAPTVLSFLGIEAPPSFAGKSLEPLILEGKPVNEYVFAGSSYSPRTTNRFFRHQSIIVSVRGRDWKLITEKLFYPEKSETYHELFNVRKDPEELQDVQPANETVFNDLAQRLRDWLVAIRAETYLEALQKK